jgi:hypothetical protein
MEILITILIVFTLTYVVARIVNLAEESKIKATLEEYERRRQRKIKSLYGKEDED